MGVYLSDRDKLILNFIEQYGGITINQAANMFFSKYKYGYDQARRRLRTMYQNKVVKRFKADTNSEVQYYFNKPNSIHKSKLLDVYTTLNNIGNVVEFQRELKIGNRKIDGFIEFEVEDQECISTYPLIIEVDYTHNTSLEKLKEIYYSNYFQADYDSFPSVLVIKKYEWQDKFKTDLFYYKFINWDLLNLQEVFL